MTGRKAGAMMAVMVRVIAVLCMVASCSFLAMPHVPSDYDGTSTPDCTTSQGTVAVDILFAALNLAGIIAIAADDDPRFADQRDKAVAGSALDALVWGVSALAGHGWARDCRKARTKWKRYQQDQEARRKHEIEEEIERRERERREHEELIRLRRQATDAGVPANAPPADAGVQPDAAP